MQCSAFERGHFLSVLSFECSSAFTDEKRAESQQRRHDASHAGLDVLPKIDPNRVVVSKTRHTNTGDNDHGDGQTQKSAQTDLLR